MTTHSGAKGEDSKDTTCKGKSKGSKSGNSVKSSKGGIDKSTFKGKGDPLAQRLVCRTQRGRNIVLKLMLTSLKPNAARLFSRPPVGVGVSQAWGVERGQSHHRQKTPELDLNVDVSRNSRGHESHGCHHDP